MPEDDLVLYVVFGRPRDYPGEFVVRRWSGRHNTPLDLGEPFARGKTLGDVRRALPAGLFNLGRQPMDDPWIVEVWV